MFEYAIKILEKDKEELREYIDDCCIQAQKLIGTDDFVVWEKKRRKKIEQEIYSIQYAIEVLRNMQRLNKDLYNQIKWIIADNIFDMLYEFFPFKNFKDDYNKKIIYDYIHNMVKLIKKELRIKKEQKEVKK